ncbi:hypothetical protein NN561_003060 [Cricetulus griseus]
MESSGQSSHGPQSQADCFSPRLLTYEVTHGGSVGIAVTLPKRHGSSRKPSQEIRLHRSPTGDSTRSVPEAPPLRSSASRPLRGARQRAGRGTRGLGAPAARAWRFPLRVTLGGLGARMESCGPAPHALELRAQLQYLHLRPEDRSSPFGA